MIRNALFFLMSAPRPVMATALLPLPAAIFPPTATEPFLGTAMLPFLASKGGESGGAAKTSTGASDMLTFPLSVSEETDFPLLSLGAVPGNAEFFPFNDPVNHAHRTFQSKPT